MKFSICNEIFKHLTLEQTFRFVKETGYDAIELAPFTLADSVTLISQAERRRIRALAEQIGLEISALHWLLVKPDGLYINHPEQGIRRRTSDYFVELVKFASDLGASSIIIGSPNQRRRLPDVTEEQSRQWTLETLTPAILLGELRHVTLCIEPLSKVETNFINTAAEAIELTKAICSPAFQIILDVKAMYAEGTPLPDIITSSRGHVAYFHANDRNLSGPGFGDVDFIPIFQALHQINYQGYVSVEVFEYNETPEQIAEGSLHTLQKAYLKALQLYNDSATFHEC